MISKSALGGLLIGLSGLSVLTWYRGPNIIYFWDSAFPFNPRLTLYQSLFLWQPQMGTGLSNSRELLSVPYYLMIFLLNQVFPLYLSQILLTFVLFVVGGIGTYAFILDSLDHRHGAAVAGGLFYMYNIFVVGTHTFFLNYIFLYAFAPVALWMTRRALSPVSTGRRPWHYALGLQAVVFLMLPGLASTLIPVAAFFAAYIVFRIVSQGKFVRQAAKAALFAGVLVTITNLWWMLPVASSSQSLVSSASSTFRSNVEGGSYVNLTLLNTLRLLGTVGLQTKSPAPEFWWAPLFNATGPLGLLSFLIPGIVFSGLLLRRRSSEVYFFALTLMALVALTSAVSFIPGYVNIAETYSALLIVATNPHLSIGLIMLFGLAYLFGNGLDSMFAMLAPSGPSSSQGLKHSLIRRPLTKRTTLAFALTVTILLSVIGAVAFPVWTGDLLPSNLPARVTVPAYQQSLAEYLLAQPNRNFRTLSLPLATIDASNWYVGLNILRWQTGLPILSTIVTLNDPGVRLYYRLNSVIESGQTTEFAKLLALANIRYVVVRNDAVFPVGFTPQFNLTKIHQFLGDQRHINFLGSFGKMDLYESTVIPGKIYAANVTFVEKDELTSFVLSPNFDPIGQAIISDATVKIFSASYSRPELTYQMISPVEYSISISGAPASFVLVFSETFDPEWNAYVNGKTLQTHFTVNDYANAWFVPFSGTFQIKLRYDPQTVVTIGSLTSIFSLVGVLASWALLKHLGRLNSRRESP